MLPCATSADTCTTTTTVSTTATLLLLFVALGVQILGPGLVPLYELAPRCAVQPHHLRQPGNIYAKDVRF